MSYKNNGPIKDGGKNYLVVNGSRVYTGQKFEASDEDIKGLSTKFNIGGLKPKKAKSAPKPVKETLKIAEAPVKEEEAVFETEEDAIDSASKSSNYNKGVK